ncbi:glycoside hydrolase family 18 protein [Allokutzneria albata]|uniref:Glycosyl hydrolases family 18 n=1 Tax=Allokutzneria albata TaxID=211114 RepID=A0A1G9SW73_ALLAB|nr:hypothetical protein [Allokutzneria albata]SDM39709.1 hypothetical protein SAMN04489726_1419 [Allokutzneria albata]
MPKSLRVAVFALATVVLTGVVFEVRVLLGFDSVLWVALLVALAVFWVVAVVKLRVHRAVIALAVVLAPVLVVTGGGGWLLAQNLASAERASGTDALWMGHAWVDGRRTQSDVDALVARVREAKFRDLYVHSGPLSDDGSLDPALRPSARWLVDTLHKALPGVRVQAWLGNVVDEGRLNLADPASRTRIVDSGRQVLDDGFDGVHYNFEPVPEGNRDLLEVLTTAREMTRSRAKVLSVSANQIEPVRGTNFVGQTLRGKPHWWSATYIGEVARRVDQIAVMSYDSGIPVESAYTGYLRMQTRLALQVVPPEVDVLIGVPAYHDGPMHTLAETVAAAVKGIRLGVTPGRRVGAAVYVDFAATPEDWAQYLSGWVR